MKYSTASLFIFGGQNTLDLYLTDNCNIQFQQNNNFGEAYELPLGVQRGSLTARNYLAGGTYKVVELEVY